MKDSFYNTLDLIPNGILVLNLQEKRVTYANSELQAVMGMSSLDQAFDSPHSSRSQQQLISNRMHAFYSYKYEHSDQDTNNSKASILLDNDEEELDLWGYLLQCQTDNSL